MPQVALVLPHHERLAQQSQSILCSSADSVQVHGGGTGYVWMGWGGVGWGGVGLGGNPHGMCQHKWG